MRGQPKSRSRSISISGNQVIKIQEPGDSQRERLRTLAGRKVGEQTGLFAVPAILSFDDSRGEIVFERLQLTGLRQALSEADGSLDLVERTARALAAIHGQMEAGTTAGAGSAGRGMNRNEVPLHGDFGMRNVFLLPASNQIAIIDWANADWTQVDADLGVPEIDIAVFLVSLFHRRIFGPWPLTHRREMARHFLATYAADSPFGLDLQILSSIVAVFRPAFTRLVRRRKGGLRALGSRHAMMDLDFFLRGLSREKYQRLEPQRTG